MIKIFTKLIKSKVTWLVVLLIATLTISIFYAKSTPEKDFTQILIMGVLVSLLINLVSSFVTIVLIEERDKRKLEHIESTRQSVVIGKLIKAIRDYNEFFANAYKATSVGNIDDLDARSANIYYETDKLIEHLNKLDLKKDGYKIHYQSRQDIFRHIELGKLELLHYSWIDILIMKSKSYIENLSAIEENFIYCLNNQKLIESIKSISDYRYIFNSAWSTNNFEMVKENCNFLHCDMRCKQYSGEIKLGYLFLGTLGTIFSTIELMSEIDKITGKSNFSIEKTKFTAKNTAPKLGSGIDEVFCKTEAPNNA